MALPGTDANSGLNDPREKSNHWQRLESLFNAASELEERDRSAFLAQACGDDTALRSEVESLLASADHTLGFLQQPVQQAAQKIAAGAATYKRIGPYELIRMIGSGGMGDVYLAARADEQYQKQVAIKLMQAAAEQRQFLIPRFRSERQILANLDHPNIARLLDGGVTPDGSPYLVMEYVDGVPIDVYCRRHELRVEQRLQLFQKVCAAVEYAHHHLIVHRDIKPANILVTEEGVPKLLDFGIAKLLDPSERSLEPTRPTERVMTPEYASPEQILGKPITTATDVYGLGVLLYELLVGVRPFRAGKGSITDLPRAICEQDPEIPSRAAAANPEIGAPDVSKLKSELDSVVLKSMSKDPAARYDSAAAFSADIAAYLNGYPLSTRSGSWTYLTGKWIQRHKWRAGFAMAAVLMVIGFIAAVVIFVHRAQIERLRAEREARFLVDLFRAATPEVDRGHTVTARDLLDQGAKRIDSELASTPAVHASMLEIMAQAYTSLGLFEQAQNLAERSYRLSAATFGSTSAETASVLFLLADLIRKRGDYAKAEPLFRDLVAIQKRTLGETNVEYAAGLAGLGECLYLQGKDEQAEPLLRQALSIYRHNGPDSGSEARNYLALLLERKGSYDEAGALLREAVEIDRRRVGVDNPDYAISLHNLGSALIDQGDLNGAEAKLREALAIRRRVLGNDHPALTYSLNNLGYVLLEKGEAAKAEPFLREALEVYLKRFGPANPQIAPSLNNWGRLQHAKGNYAEAARYFDRAISVLREGHLFPGWTASQIQLNLGLLEFDQGNYTAAETWARQGLEMKRRLGGEDTLAQDSALIDLAEDQLFQGDPSSAEPLLRQALEKREKKYSPKHPLVIAAQVRLGEALIAEGKESEASPILWSAMAAAHTAPFPLLRWQTAEVESALAACLLALHRTDEAQPLMLQSQTDLLSHPRPAFRKPAAVRLMEMNLKAHQAMAGSKLK